MSNAMFPGIGLPTAPTAPTMPSGTVSGGGGNFADTLKSAIGSVDQLNQTSDSQVTELLHGDRQDIHNVMIAVEKADVSFQLMMQVRNKILNAYQEVSKLQF
ncbi:MAG: flagellar hook-basal body complex protein FliE [Terriglobales bacterium]